MKSEKYDVVFVYSENGYYVNFVDGNKNKVMFKMPEPIAIYFKSV